MTRWYSEKKKEHYYKEAKRVGYRARSAFKLKQIQDKFNIIKKGDFVIDLGAAPGGWSQVAKELVGDQGKVIGIDLDYIKPIDGITFLQGDLTAESTLEELKNIAGGKKADVILSDMSPDISGNYSVDQARSVYLCEHSLKLATMLLKPGGNFVCKVFEGEDLHNFISKINKKFKMVKQFSPPASRKSSSEIYIVARCLQN
ncbi:MAG: RlmE family RNA methyltransferase [Candidatus Thermoplasmatota archaeon]|jgi:23S rRNA (uridine2552-2'-O)-methyltransferase|nr:RlmE family RNA methyltransferase [Candidatus Thermoplasmatota archaeon]